ncbi:hypothetical protein M3226_29525 [Neobacillus cucumis]|uniref:hypothetical protein n=1 Tax=Neobacillus cucumis TaxID=1740721 RepID=UPI00204038BE|nr:hypothetical protein [Neobacillus cucumis]MCM3729711.1 hypothetical protein [Neobacillus cucumis]
MSLDEILNNLQSDLSKLNKQLDNEQIKDEEVNDKLDAEIVGMQFTLNKGLEINDNSNLFLKEELKEELRTHLKNLKRIIGDQPVIPVKNFVFFSSWFVEKIQIDS